MATNSVTAPEGTKWAQYQQNFDSPVSTTNGIQGLQVKDYFIAGAKTGGALAVNLIPVGGTGNLEIDGNANAAHAFFFFAGIHTAVIALQPELTPYAAPQAVIGFGSGGYFSSKMAL